MVVRVAHNQSAQSRLDITCTSRHYLYLVQAIMSNYAHSGVVPIYVLC